MTFDRLLIYVTGGGAWARDEFSYTIPAVGSASTKQNRTGWTVGAGVEYGLSPNWSIAAQYNYIDLGDKDVTFGAPVGPFTAPPSRISTSPRCGSTTASAGGPLVARY